MEADHQRAFEAGDNDRPVEDFEEGGLDFFGQLAIGGAVLEIKLTDFFFDKAAKGFEEVIGKGKGVVAVSVVDADCGQETCAAQGASDGGPQDDVAVVEPRIGRRPLAMPTEGRVLEEDRPESGGGLGLDIFGVSGPYAAAEGHQGPIG